VGVTLQNVEFGVVPPTTPPPLSLPQVVLCYVYIPKGEKKFKKWKPSRKIGRLDLSSLLGLWVLIILYISLSSFPVHSLNGRVYL